VAFLYVRQDHWDDLEPLNANWRASDRPYERYFGGPLSLAANAARFDVSLAWLPWVGARESLRLLEEWRRSRALSKVLGLAQRLAAELRLAPPAASLVSVPVRDTEAAEAALEESHVRAAVRAGSIRLAPHLYNDEADIARAAAVIGPFCAD
jgi:selenocysteine lyase/cysteine desulfurase